MKVTLAVVFKIILHAASTSNNKNTRSKKNPGENKFNKKEAKALLPHMYKHIIYIQVEYGIYISQRPGTGGDLFEFFF